MNAPPREPREPRATIAARGQRRFEVSSGELATPLLAAAAAPSPLERAQLALPGPLRSVPLQALTAGVSLALVTLFTLTVALARGEGPVLPLEGDEVTVDGGLASAPAPIAAEPTAAVGGPLGGPRAPAPLSAADLDAARLAGVDALRDLARRYPDEPSVLKALACALRERQDLVGAAHVVRQLLEVAPDNRADKDVQRVVLDVAMGPPESAPEAFELMREKMESAGPDLLFELATASQPPNRVAHDRALAALTDPAVLHLGTKALQIASELHRALPCARKLLLARAKADGDARSLPYLKSLLPNPKGCGGSGLSRLFRSGADCGNYACFTPSDKQAIAAAIEAIEKR